MTYQLTIDPGGVGRQYDEGDLSQINFGRTHSGLGNFEVEVPYDLSLEDRLFDEVHLGDGSEFLFRGFLETTDSNERRGTTRLSGRGIAKLLKEGGAAVRYQQVFVHEAIFDYFARFWWPATFDDGFEDGDVAEWAGDTGNLSATTDPVHDGTYAATLDASGAGSEQTVYRAPSSVEDRGADLWVNVGTSDVVEFWIGTATRVARVRANSGTWEYYDGASSSWVASGEPVEVGWEQVELVADTSEDLFSAYIDGIGIAQRVPAAASVSSIDRVAVSAAAGSSATIDDVILTETNTTVYPPSANTSVTGRQAQYADSVTDFSDIVTVPDDVPLAATGVGFETLPVSWNMEHENMGNVTTEVFGDRWSNQAANEVVDANDGQSFTFTIDHRIPADSVGVVVRMEVVRDFEHPGWDASIDGDFVFDRDPDTQVADLNWEYNTLTPNSDLQPGTHTFDIDIQANADADPLILDITAVYDDRYLGTGFDNTTDSNNYLSEPERYPASVVQEFAQEDVPWNVTDGYLDVTMSEADETPNALQMQLSGGAWYPSDGSEQNTTSVSTDFGNEAGTILKGRVDFGRSGDTRTTATPTDGYKGQKIDVWDLTYDGNDIAFFDDTKIEGDHLRNLIRLHEFAAMRFVVSHEANARPAASFRAGDQPQSKPDWTVKNRTRSIKGRGYANRVTVRGKTDSSTGDRPTATVEDESEISAVGRALGVDMTDPSIETANDVLSKARSELGSRIQNRERTGRLEIVPIGIDPGYSYPVDWPDGTTDTISLEEITYDERGGDARGTLKFDLDPDLVEAVAGLRGTTGRNTDAL